MARTSVKRQLKCKCGQAVTTKPAVIYCPSCGSKMSETGDRFFDHVKVVNIHMSKKYEGYYLFNLSLGGLVINGFTYSAYKRAVLMPKGFDGRHKVVKAFGAVVNRIRSMVEKQISQLDGTGIGETVEYAQ